MAIDVEWQNERGDTLRKYVGPVIDGALVECAQGTSCLRFIDPYGDTTFNDFQVAVLEEELASLTSGAGKVAEQARSLLEFVRQQSDKTHVYLKFLGD